MDRLDPKNLSGEVCALTVRVLFCRGLDLRFKAVLIIALPAIECRYRHRRQITPQILNSPVTPVRCTVGRSRPKHKRRHHAGLAERYTLRLSECTHTRNSLTP